MADKVGIQVNLPVELVDKMRHIARTRPGLTLSKLAMNALEPWLTQLEARRFELTDPYGNVLVKEPGEPFPQRLGTRSRVGRPLAGEESQSSPAPAKLYLPKSLAERLKNAAWWRIRYPAWDAAEALSQYLEEA